MKRLIFLLCLIPLSSFGNTKEEQYICEFNTEVIIGNSTSEKPTPTVKKINEKYTFFLDGKNGSYINLSHGTKIPLYVIKETNRTIFVERNTSDNLFVVTVFMDKKTKNNRYGSVKSFISNGVTSNFYDPSQSFGDCIVIKN
jgi:hypothetical protein